MFAGPRLVGALLAGALATAALAVAVPGGAWLGVVLVNLAVAPLFGASVVAAPRPRTLGLERTMPEVTGIGREETVALTVRNPGHRPVEVTVRDASPPSLRRDPRVHRAVIAPGARARFEAQVRPSRRGDFAVGPVTLRTAALIGLGGRQATLALPGRIKVYPALPGRAEVELRLERARLLQAGERSTAVRGGGTEFDSLREYHPDDEFRRINWRASARAGKPISNQYREERNQQVMLLLDTGRTMAANVAGVSRFEHAIDAGMAVAELAARVGDHVGMVAFGSDVLAAAGPRGGRAQARRILDVLYGLEPGLEAPNYRLAFASLLTRYRRRSLLVLLTELADEGVLEPLFQAVPSLLARHLVVVGSVLDPDLAVLARSAPGSSEQAYLKAAAAEALEARERAAGRLRRLGAVVVDAAPGKLAGELADQYLKIKAYGRL